MEIKILGSGCTNCKKLEANTKEAVKALGIEANITKVEDIKFFQLPKFMKHYLYCLFLK